MKKLNCVLLIDDDEPTNFLNEMIISQLDCTERIVAVQSGLEALAYLTNDESGGCPQPDLILLDINMPGMNGWEFLEKYRVLDQSQRGTVVVVMLTTSLNPDDEAKAHGMEDIDTFMKKPLTKEMFSQLLKERFPNR